MRGLIGAALLAAMLAALPAAADAAKKKAKPGKLQTATATTSTTVDDQAVTATATCPKGTTVVGGGYVTGTDPPGGPLSDFHVVTESHRASKTAWIVGAYRLDGGGAGPSLPVTAEAYCRKNAGKVSEVSATKAVPTSTSFVAPSVACPLGRALVGGGFKIVPANTTGLSFVQVESRPLGSVGWTSSGLGVVAGPNSLTAYAYCRKGSTKVATRTSSAAMPATAGPVVKATTPKCPAKLFPFAGGYEGPSFYTGSALPAVIESRSSGGAWAIGMLNLSSNPGTFSLHGVCS